MISIGDTETKYGYDALSIVERQRIEKARQLLHQDLVKRKVHYKKLKAFEALSQIYRRQRLAS